MCQMKDQDNSKKEISNLLEKEFRVMVIKMNIKFRRRMRNTERMSTKRYKI